MQGSMKLISSTYLSNLSREHYFFQSISTCKRQMNSTTISRHSNLFIFSAFHVVVSWNILGNITEFFALVTIYLYNKNITATGEQRQRWSTVWRTTYIGQCVSQHRTKKLNSITLTSSNPEYPCTLMVSKLLS